jgi:hypothetical protein
VEHHLNDTKGPVLLVSPIYVADLNIEALAAEDEGMLRKRVEAENRLARLHQSDRLALECNRGGEVGVA